MIIQWLGEYSIGPSLFELSPPPIFSQDRCCDCDNGQRKSMTAQPKNQLAADTVRAVTTDDTDPSLRYLILIGRRECSSAPYRGLYLTFSGDPLPA